MMSVCVFFCFVSFWYFTSLLSRLVFFVFTHFTLSCIYTKSLFLYHISSCILSSLVSSSRMQVLYFRSFPYWYRFLYSVLLLGWKISLESHTHTHVALTHVKENEKLFLFAEQIRPSSKHRARSFKFILSFSLTRTHNFISTSQRAHSSLPRIYFALFF